MKRPSRRTIGYLLLAILYSFILFCVWVIIADYPISPFNPPPSQTTIPISIGYPPTVGLIHPGYGLEVKFVLEPNGTIGERVNISMDNATADRLSNAFPDLMVVAIGFEETVHSSSNGPGPINGTNYWGTGLQGAVFLGNWVDPTIANLTLMSEDVFYFPVAGDYSPTIYMHSVTGSDIVYTYSQYKIHVLSASELYTQKLDRINTVVAIALLSFAFIEGIIVVRDLTKSKRKRIRQDTVRIKKTNRSLLLQS